MKEVVKETRKPRPASRGSLVMGVIGALLLAVTLYVIGALPDASWGALRVLAAGFVSGALAWWLIAARRPSLWTGAQVGLAAMPCGLWLNWYLFLFDLWYRNEYQLNPADKLDASFLSPVANLGQALDCTAMSLAYPGYACIALFVAAGALLGRRLSRPPAKTPAPLAKAPSSPSPAAFLLSLSPPHRFRWNSASIPWSVVGVPRM